MAFGNAARQGKSHSCPFPKMAGFRPSAFGTFPHWGCAALALLSDRTTTTGPSIYQTALQARVECDHKRWCHHLAPPLIEGCGRHVITHAPVNSSRMGSPRHRTSKQRTVLPMRAAIYETGAIFRLGLGLEGLGFEQLPCRHRRPSRLNGCSRTRKTVCDIFTRLFYHFLGPPRSYSFPAATTWPLPSNWRYRPNLE